MTTISWKSIEHEWAVECSNGETIGKVFRVVGDENTDIFDGIAFTHHGGAFVFHNYADRPHYVAAEQVASIDPGVVRTRLRAASAPTTSPCGSGVARLVAGLRGSPRLRTQAGSSPSSAMPLNIDGEIWTIDDASISSPWLVRQYRTPSTLTTPVARTECAPSSTRPAPAAASARVW